MINKSKVYIKGYCLDKNLGRSLSTMNLVKIKLQMELLKNYCSSIESNSYMEHGTLNFA